MKKDIHILGQRIREERLQRGWTLHELSQRTGISVSHLSAIERGERDFTVSCLLLLVDAYRIAPNTLLRGQFDSTEPQTQNIEKLADDCAEYIKSTIEKYQIVKSSS